MFMHCMRSCLHVIIQLWGKGLPDLDGSDGENCKALACDAELTGLTMVLRIVQETIKHNIKNQPNSNDFLPNNKIPLKTLWAPVCVTEWVWRKWLIFSVCVCCLGISSRHVSPKNPVRRQLTKHYFRTRKISSTCFCVVSFRQYWGSLFDSLLSIQNDQPAKL